MAIIEDFSRQCVSVGALVLTICLVKIVTPSVTEFIESNPQIHSRAAEIILTISGWNESGQGQHTGAGLSENSH